MIFWIICIVLTAVVAGLVVMPLLRGDQLVEDAPDVAFYRAQLEELDRDLERGVLDIAEAERARVEVARRLIAADARAAEVTPSPPAPMLAIAVILLAAGMGLGGYFYLGVPGYADLPLKARIATSDEMRASRPTQKAMEAAAAPAAPATYPDDYLESVARLRQIVPTRPDELAGWELLAYHESQLRNYPAAVAAQARVLALKGADATIEDRTRIVDVMVMAADGFVSPEAEGYVRQILEADPENVAGLYYMGALYYQTDRPDVALRLWRPVAADGDPTQYHVQAIRAQIEDAAYLAGVKYTLPAAVGPSAEDIANASDMSAEDRQGMIQGMVSQLAGRLADEGGPASEWARLIGAYGVLGETEKASEVWLEASEVFAGSVGAMETLRAAAVSAGVAE